MRKVLLIATLSACAATHSAPGKGSGSGSGSGSGMPACTENCAGSFTIDDTGFIVQGDMWWASTSAPKLTGTIETNGGTLKLYSGDVAVGTATIANGTWFVELPDGTIPTTGVTLHFELTAAGAQKVTQDQLFQLDNGMPAFTSNSIMRDERGDAISFTTGEPVHAHAGAAIDLGNGCPNVFKYTYLTDVTPKYVTETSPNPLAWHVSIASPVGIDDTGTSYRVRDAASTVVDWTAMSPDADGSYTIELHRDGAHPVADLGIYDGMIYVDVQARDDFGMTSTQTYCINYQRLAPPLDIQPMQKSTLFGFTLADDSPISEVLNNVGGPPAFSQVFVQHAAEPVTMGVSLSAPTGKYNLVAADDYIKLGSGSVTCGTKAEPDTTTKGCSTVISPGTNQDTTTTNAALTKGNWSVVVFDDVAGVPYSACTSNGAFATCSIPARADGAAPHPYRVVAYGDDMENLWPTKTGPFGEFIEASRNYTGNAPIEFSHCDILTVNTTTTVRTCSYSTWAHIRAISSASVAFDAFDLSYSARLSGQQLVPVPYAYPEKSAPFTWDLGTDVLPGQ